MIGSLLPYPDMKTTGLPWLGDIPTHWDVRRNGRLFGARRETGFPHLPILEVSIRTGVRIRDFDNGGRKQEMADRSKYQRAACGDIAYNMMRMWQGAVGIAPADGLVSPAYVVARPFDETDAAYYAYLFRTAAYMREIDVFSRGIVPDRNRLYWESFKQMASVYPPLDEQRLIVRFLDWHGAQTAKLIRAKKKLIALLNEQKQAIIHRAVTRGLDPNSKLKPSGIPWLGDVPEKWTVQSLGSMVRRRSVRNRTDLPLLSVVRERGVILRSSMSDEENHNFVPDDLSNYKVAMRGDLVINKMKAWQGSLGIAPCDGIVSPAYFVYQLAIEDIQFGQMLLRSKPYVACFARVSDGVRIGQWDLSIDGMKRIPVLRPSHDEQAAIVEFVDRSTVELVKVKEFTLNEIALLQEFRTRLINDVITGRLDVRSEAAGLPEVSEIMPPDEPQDDDEDEIIDLAEDEQVAA
jgi:type I restriction enzyme, S subunit